MVLESAAAWAEKAVSQRDQYLLVLLSSLAGAEPQSSTHWHRIARLTNLPGSFLPTQTHLTPTPSR
jgi:hypothetical protein